MESPIDVYDDILKFEELPPLEISNLNRQVYSEVMNTGQGIVISISPQKSPVIKGGGLPFPEYLIYQIYFRWDSEHTINKEKFPLEVQIVTVAKEHRHFENALEQKGVAIFSVLYNYSHIENDAVAQLLPIIPFIGDEINKSIPFDALNLSQFLPKNIDEFYRYEGSLTVEPYTSGVTWTIFKEKQGITRPQMGFLSDILDENGELVVFNNCSSRNVNSVIYSSGKYNLKCKCPPRVRIIDGEIKKSLKDKGDNKNSKIEKKKILKESPEVDNDNQSKETNMESVTP